MKLLDDEDKYRKYNRLKTKCEEEKKLTAKVVQLKTKTNVDYINKKQV